MGGSLFCQLNRDGTAITVVPRAGLHFGEARAAGRNRWVGGTGFLETVAAGMSQAEQAEALYTYLTQNVDYDFRYYSHPGKCPMNPPPPTGSPQQSSDLRRVCTGVSNALERRGFPALRSAGKQAREPHVEYGQDRWPLALLRSHRRSGQGRLWFPLYCGVEGEALDRHTWMQIGSTGSQKLYFHCDCKVAAKELGRADPHRV